MKSVMRFEMLTLEGCPHAMVARDHLLVAARAEGILATVVENVVDPLGDARLLRFLGSPTIRIGGVDVEPGADERTEYGFMCRTYAAGDRTSGAPTVEMIRAAIRVHLERTK
jgi:hypothetical protein